SELSRLAPSEFLEKRVGRALTPKFMIVGHDFAFGANRSGSLAFLTKWCSDREVDLRIQAPVEIAGERISSRLIREFIGEGRVAKAARFLGRAFYLDGIVEKGAGRGKTISVPTMNFLVGDRLAPKTGVYVTETVIDEQIHRSISNLGVNPTFGG